jgi:hypothetical protein
VRVPATVVAASSGLSITIAGVIWVLLLITFGVISLRKGHWVMFVIGLFIPLFWLIGALIPPVNR